MLTQEQQKLVSDNLNLARQIAYRYSRNQQEYEDREQSAFEALCRAAAGYDPNRGAAFSTYAYPAIERELQRIITIENRQLPTVSIDTPIGEKTTIGDTLADEDDFTEHISDPALREATKTLDKRTAHMLYLYYKEGMTYDEIGNIYHITRSRVGQIIKKGLDKLSKRML